MNFISNILGLDSDDLLAYQMAARAFVIFTIALVFIRIAGLRTLGKQSAFDHLTVIILGAILGRTIVASQSFEGSILAAFVIMIMHRLIAWLSFKNKKAGKLFKGNPIPLIKDNVDREANMRKTHITKDDILEALRTELNTDDLSKLKDAYLERSGKISVVKR